MSDYILTTDSLTKKFGRYIAVNGIDMHVPKGSIYGFIGRNGAGKTTTLKIMAGLAKQSSGNIEIMGETGAGLGRVREKVGCLIEAPGIYPDLNAYENLYLKCIVNGTARQDYINGLLELVGLSDTGRKKAGKFSLGMKQRLGIAMALVGEPEILVLDEPINGLDPQGIIEVREILTRLNQERGITIIISSHILDELSKIATAYGIIDKGNLIKELTADELETAGDEMLEIRVDDVEKAVRIVCEMGITKYKAVDDMKLIISERVDESAGINEKLVMAGVKVSELNVKKEELENYYIELTGGVKQ